MTAAAMSPLASRVMAKEMSRGRERGGRRQNLRPTRSSGCLVFIPTPINTVAVSIVLKKSQDCAIRCLVHPDLSTDSVPPPPTAAADPMRLPRRVPWVSLADLDQVCSWIYADDADWGTKTRALHRVFLFFFV